MQRTQDTASVVMPKVLFVQVPLIFTVGLDSYVTLVILGYRHLKELPKQNTH